MITDSLLKSVDTSPEELQSVLVSNSRHYEALTRADEAIQAIRRGIANQISGDLLSIDLRSALHHLGSITGEVTSDDVLGEIFGRFCIGK